MALELCVQLPEFHGTDISATLIVYTLVVVCKGL